MAGSQDRWFIVNSVCAGGHRCIKVAAKVWVREEQPLAAPHVQALPPVVLAPLPPSWAGLVLAVLPALISPVGVSPAPAPSLTLS